MTIGSTALPHHDVTRLDSKALVSFTLSNLAIVNSTAELLQVSEVPFLILMKVPVGGVVTRVVVLDQAGVGEDLDQDLTTVDASALYPSTLMVRSSTPRPGFKDNSRSLLSLSHSAVSGGGTKGNPL
jgi:hypothetical protein